MTNYMFIPATAGYIYPNLLIVRLDFTNIAEIPFVFMSSPKLSQNFATASKIQWSYLIESQFTFKCAISDLFFGANIYERYIYIYKLTVCIYLGKL